ncbi:MAG: DUF1127 domain-containing protein [Tabrizicola sp.]
MPRKADQTLIPSRDVIMALDLPPISRVLVGLGLALARWGFRHRTRTALSRLDPHLLRDIGLSQDKRATECAKPFWQA